MEAGPELSLEVEEKGKSEKQISRFARNGRKKSKSEVGRKLGGGAA